MELSLLRTSMLDYASSLSRDDETGRSVEQTSGPMQHDTFVAASLTDDAAALRIQFSRRVHVQQCRVAMLTAHGRPVRAPRDLRQQNLFRLTQQT